MLARHQQRRILSAQVLLYSWRASEIISDAGRFWQGNPMNKSDRNQSKPSAVSFSRSAQCNLSDAARYWEPRRIPYNLVLTAVVTIWVAASWPHFRPAFNLHAFALLIFLAVLANVCYSAAYFVDVPMRWLLQNGLWDRRRWLLWLAGTLFAVLLANYWIADEIYPFIR